MTVLDSNTNRVISAEEITAAPTVLKKLDKNSDGQLSADELRPQGAGSPPAGAPAGNTAGGTSGARPQFVPPLLKALDANSDGILSKEEIANAATALKTLDKNSDGQLTQDEIMPQRPGGAGGPGGGGRGAGPGGQPPSIQ